MAQLRFKLIGDLEVKVSLSDVMDVGIMCRIVGLVPLPEPSQLNFPTLPALEIRHENNSSDGVVKYNLNEQVFILQAAPALKLQDFLGQRIQVILGANRKVIEGHCPARFFEEFAPPELDPLLTAMMEDDDIVMKAAVDAPEPKIAQAYSLPHRFADEAAEALSTYQDQETEEGFILFDLSELDERLD